MQNRQDPQIRVHEQPNRYPDLAIQAPGYGVRLSELPQSPLPPQFQYSVKMVERDWHVENHSVDFLGKDMQDWQKKNDAMLDPVGKGQRLVRDGQKELYDGLDDLRRNIASLRAELSDQLNAGKVFEAPDTWIPIQSSTWSDGSNWKFNGASSHHYNL